MVLIINMDRSIKVICIVVVWVLASFSNPVLAQFFNNPLSEAVDNYRFNFLNSTIPGFERIIYTSTRDGDSAWSGNVKDDDLSIMYVQLQGGEEISWDWTVDSEENYDFLAFFVFDSNFETIDDLTQLISGSVYWTRASSKIPDGPHEAVWAYVKDETISFGRDAGWVDNVKIKGGASDNSKKFPPIINLLLDESYLPPPPDIANLYPPIPNPLYNEPVVAIESEEGEFLGDGKNYYYNASNSSYRIRSNSHRGVQIKIDGNNDESTIETENWVIQFSHYNRRLTKGTYEDAIKFPENKGTIPGLTVIKNDVECIQIDGGFRIYEIKQNADGEFTRLIADFEISCDGSDKKLKGSIKFDKSLNDYVNTSPIPSDSIYPAIPESGVKGPLVRIISHPDETRLSERDYHFDELNSNITITENIANIIRVRIQTDFHYSWQFSSNGDQITAGSYPSAVGFGGEGRGCSSNNEGSFRIFEIERNLDGDITKLIADFMERCGPDRPPLFLSIKYDSTLPGGILPSPPIPSEPLFPEISDSTSPGSKLEVWSSRYNSFDEYYSYTKYSLDDSNALFTYSTPTFNLSRTKGVQVDVQLNNSFERLQLIFVNTDIPSDPYLGENIRPGTYGRLASQHGSGTYFGMSLRINSTGCLDMDGRVRIINIEFDELEQLIELDADFERYCGDNLPSVGSIRYRR